MTRPKILLQAAALALLLLPLAQGLPLPQGLAPLTQGDECRLLRFPDVHQDTIVFVYGGDIWTVSAEGGMASRLTTFPGSESKPKFSPDGKTIAFNASYDGNGDLYSMGVDGGAPKRLTYHPDGDSIIDWMPDGKTILFNSGRESNSYRYRKIFAISKDGGLAESLPMPRGGLASASPD